MLKTDLMKRNEKKKKKKERKEKGGETERTSVSGKISRYVESRIVTKI